MANEIQTNGNSEKTTKAPSILAKIHQEWLAKGGKKPDEKTLASLKKELGAVQDEFEAASKALEDAREKRNAVALKVVKACGTKGTIKLADGRLYEATARGEQVFFRAASGDTY